ncbi:MAG: hypothetical protein AAFN92_20910, partial [Bacteroidota bacterium]
MSLDLKCRIEWDQAEQEYYFAIDAVGKSVATLVVADVAGQIVLRRQLRLRAGYNEFRLPDFNNLDSGTYGYRLRYAVERSVMGMLTK